MVHLGLMQISCRVNQNTTINYLITILLVSIALISNIQGHYIHTYSYDLALNIPVVYFGFMWISCRVNQSTIINNLIPIIAVCIPWYQIFRIKNILPVSITLISNIQLMHLGLMQISSRVNRSTSINNFIPIIPLFIALISNNQNQ